MNAFEKSSKNVRRILMTTDTVGGVWTYVCTLIHELWTYGIEVALATMGPALDNEQRKEIESYQNVMLFESNYKLEWMEDPWNDVRMAGNWLLDCAAIVQPDLVHLNGYAHGGLPWNVPVMIVAHSCVYSWFKSVLGTEPPSEWETYKEMVIKGLQLSDRVIAPTNAMLHALEAPYGKVPNGSVIYNGTHQLSNTTQKDTLIVTGGRIWDKAKNIGIIRDISPNLKWPVYVAGDGGESETTNMHRVGKLGKKDMADLLRRASIFVLPARYEPFGLLPLEASLAKCALVLGDIPSLREVWGDAAIFVDPNDKQKLEHTLHELIDNKGYREHMAECAWMRGKSYSATKMGQHYYNEYQDLYNIFRYRRLI